MTGRRKERLTVRLSDCPWRAREAWHDDPEDGLVVVTSVYATFKLNFSGSFVWRRCDGNHSLKEVISDASTHFDSPRHCIQDDIRGFVGVFVRAGLLNLRDSATAFDELPLQLLKGKISP
jgi:hypothetical protein